MDIEFEEFLRLSHGDDVIEIVTSIQFWSWDKFWGQEQGVEDYKNVWLLVKWGWNW